MEPSQMSFTKAVITEVADQGLKGARWGLKIGSGVLVAGTAAAGLHNGLEFTHRAIGGEPKWPVHESDYELPQFQHIQPSEISCLQLTCLALFVPTVAGAVLRGTYGGLQAVVTHLSGKDKRD